MENFWYIFGVFGIIVAGIICAIAIVWLTCFSVKILIKTFGTTVTNFNSVQKENIEKKYIAKRERMLKKREQTDAHKKEVLQLKMEKKEQINKIKLQKMEQKLNQKVQEVADKNEVEVSLETKYGVVDKTEQSEVKVEDNKEEKVKKSK